ncbi:MAG TPA: hypothetical protein VK327_02230 [Candidatus Paceibacterota bacterium]|nr:hypothetical protein [Candidatus Paceibacterota bacterium]
MEIIKQVGAKLTVPNILATGLIVLGIMAVAEMTNQTSVVISPVASLKAKLGKKTA